MSSMHEAIEIDSDSDESRNTNNLQDEVNPNGYVQPNIPTRALWIGTDDLACLTYKREDIQHMRHPFYWIEQLEMASFIRVIPDKSPNVHFVESPLLPKIDFRCDKLPESVGIYSRNLNDGNPEHDQNGHWAHFSIYKDLQKIVVAESCVADSQTWRDTYSEVIK